MQSSSIVRALITDRLFPVFVETPIALLAQAPGSHHLLEQGGRAIAIIAVFVKQAAQHGEDESPSGTDGGDASAISIRRERSERWLSYGRGSSPTLY